MIHHEPPSRAQAPLYFIGRDSHGHWVVQDQQGTRGGLFVDRTEALRYAMFENGHQAQAVVMVPGIFELDLRAAGRAAVPAIAKRRAA